MIFIIVSSLLDLSKFAKHIIFVRYILRKHPNYVLYTALASNDNVLNILHTYFYYKEILHTIITPYIYQYYSTAKNNASL